ncbi:MAG: hypothetical protein HYV63_14740 [Candidatus Schekmanbacteria bacterium]|nr:hypothetical protein [Candidatus Schekmanbacteria bacterium]
MMRSTAVTKNVQKAGRPPKFDEPRRPVTVTLPERTIQQLARVHPDRARAIALLAENAAGAPERAAHGVELVRFAPDSALILVGKSPTLAGIDGLRLVEVIPDRYLLVVPSGASAESLELALHDALNELPADADPGERAILEELARLMGHGRRQSAMSKGELLIIAL